MRAILVCVDYGDILAITLPYNRHHFTHVMVVTTPSDTETIAVAKSHGAEVFTTTSFYTNGAHFNKWLALEEGLDKYGRWGVMCIMDADILWPQEVPKQFKPGRLYTPRRRILDNPTNEIPAEGDWRFLRLFSEAEWAGYSQIFHANDPVLPSPPWHETDWLHAGGADSAFQNRWKKANKRRPDWEVLHLGLPGRNWCGRVAPRLDGTPVEGGTERELLLRHLIHLRHTDRSYIHERINTDQGG